MNESKAARLGALQRSITRLDHRLIDLQARSDQLVRLRVGIIIAGLVGAFLLFSQFGDTPGWLGVGLTLVVFNIAAYIHRRIKSGIDRHRRWRGIKQAHIARIELDWDHIPAIGDTPPPDGHPFAIDLDLIGERSMFRLLDTSVTQGGGLRLRDWLLNTHPDAASITRRQALVRELIPLAPFRDKLVLYARQASGDESRIQADRAAAWLAAEDNTGPYLYDVVILGGLAAASIILFTLATAGLLPPLWPVTFIIYVAYFLLRDTGDLFSRALALTGTLRYFNRVFAYLERYHYGDNTSLRALAAPFLDSRNRPSAQLRQVSRLAAAVSLRGNPYIWFIVNAIVPWDYYFGYRLKQRKAEIGARLPGWLDVWYELEALCSLATFAYLNPDYTFPTVGDGCTLTGERLGHPLIGWREKVRNDFQQDECGTLVIITGSNMAGKSSFLRTMGVNLVLAYAGGVTDAARLHTSLFRIYSAIRVTDSVMDGFSYFYAEVRRLRQMLDAFDADSPYPVYFLIDEIFKGTNNRERLIGSRSYIRALVGRRGLGAISTHDLDLVRLADELSGVTNAHFREHVEDGRMVFDYHLRPGPCPTTNALKIMALEGLPVDDAD